LKRFLARTLRITVRTVTTVLLVFGIVVIILSLPPVQNLAVPYAQRKLSETLNTRVTLGYINIGLPDKIVISDLAIYDQKGILLLGAKYFKIGIIDFPLREWFDSRQVRKNLSARIIQLEEPEINLYRSRADCKWNFDFLVADRPVDTTTSTQIVQVHLPIIELADLKFSFRDSTLTNAELRTQPGKVNYMNLVLDSASMEAAFELRGPGRFRAKLEDMHLRERNSGLIIQHLGADYETNMASPFDPTGQIQNLDSIPYVILRDARIVIGGTNLNFNMDLRNEKFETFFFNNAPKKYRFAFTPSTFEFASLNYFLPQALDLKGVVGLTGLVTGTPTRLRARKFEATLGRETRVACDAFLTNFTNADSFLLELNVRKSTVSPYELKQLLPKVPFPDAFLNAGTIGVEAKYIGFINDFVANGSFETEYGKLTSDVQVKIDGRRNNFSYDGRLRTYDLNVDTIVRMGSISDKLNFEGKVKGTNLDFDRMTARFDFDLHPSRLAKYDIDSVNGSISIDKKVINGNIAVTDREGNFGGRAVVSFAEKTPSYYLVGNLRNIDLKHYGAIKDSLKLTSYFDVRVTGDSLDNLGGRINLIQGRLQNLQRREEISANNVRIVSTLNTATNKSVKLESDFIDASLQGSFSYKQVGIFIRELGREAEIFLRNDTNLIKKYYAEKQKDDYLVTLGVNVTVKKLNPVLLFFRTGLQLDYGTELKSSFVFGDKNTFKIRLSSTGFVFDSLHARTISMNLFASKSAYGNDLQGDGRLLVNRMNYGNGMQLSRILLRPYAKDNAIFFNLRFDQDSARNHVQLVASTDFKDGLITTRINADSSKLVLRDSTWRFDPDNKIAYATNYLVIENFRLSSRGQSIFVESDIRPDPAQPADSARKWLADEFHATVRGLQLRSVSQLAALGVPIEGRMNTDVFIKELFGTPQIKLTGSIQRFRYASIRYGDVYARSNWNDFSRKLQLDVNLVAQGDTLLGLIGNYDAANKDSPLDFRLRTSNLPLTLLSPFAEPMLYELKGFMKLDNLHVTGKLSAPIAIGSGAFKDVSFGFSYFKTKYRFAGEVKFNRDNIQLPQILIQDAKSGSARLRGVITHTGFNNIKLDIQFSDMRNFLVMNTRKEDSELFYGRAVVKKGHGEIRGPLDKMAIYCAVTSGPGTELSIPISFYRRQQRLPFVYFKKDIKDTIKSVVKNQSGMSLTLEVEVTPDAQLNIVFDEKTDDVIRGRGEGLITMALSSSGDFSMYGSFVTTSGQYNVKQQGVINKRFAVDRGSTITWSGDAVDADMNLTAYTRVNARLQSLQGGGRNSATVPVNVLLRMRGSLLKPDITFDIQQASTASQGADLELGAVMRAIQTDPNEMNRQVVSLLAFQAFAPVTGSGFDVSGQAAGSSALELLSNQLNSMLGKALDDKITVSVAGGAQPNDLNVGIGARLFNDRLTIERNGAIASQNNRGVSIGNLSARFRLLPLQRNDVSRNPYSLEVEAFNRENLGLGNFLVSNTTGFGLFYRKEADSFFDLFRRTIKPAGNIITPIDKSKFKLVIPLDGPNEMPTDSTRKNIKGIIQR